MTIKASNSITLTRVDDGANGEDGTSGIIISETAPESPEMGQLWQTATNEPIKRWTGTEWVIHYISVENLDVDKLSAISANLGEVTAGSININDLFKVSSSGDITAQSGTIAGMQVSKDGLTYTREGTVNGIASILTVDFSSIQNVEQEDVSIITWSLKAKDVKSADDVTGFITPWMVFAKTLSGLFMECGTLSADEMSWVTDNVAYYQDTKKMVFFDD